MAVKMLKKITVRDVAGPFADLQELVFKMDDGESMDVCAVYGVASGTKTGKTDATGEVTEFTKLTGRFRAVALFGEREGNEYASGQAILPDVAQEMLVAALREGEAKGEAVAAEFGVKITAMRDKSSSIGVQYGAEPLVEVQEDSSMERLRGQVAGSIPALASPEEGEDGDEKAAPASRGRGKGAASK